MTVTNVKFFNQARLSNFEKPREAVAGRDFAFWPKTRFEQSEKLRQNGNAEREEKSSPEIFVWFSKLAKPSDFNTSQKPFWGWRGR